MYISKHLHTWMYIFLTLFYIVAFFKFEISLCAPQSNKIINLNFLTDPKEAATTPLINYLNFDLMNFRWRQVAPS